LWFGFFYRKEHNGFSLRSIFYHKEHKGLPQSTQRFFFENFTLYSLCEFCGWFFLPQRTQWFFFEKYFFTAKHTKVYRKVRKGFSLRTLRCILFVNFVVWFFTAKNTKFTSK